jgi:REP element-mobilizing transposase RayT
MVFSEFPLAYFITWTTYGSWLPGDERGWCCRGSRTVEPPDSVVRDSALEAMIGEPVVLTPEQRQLLDAVIVRHCEIRGWKLHARNVRTNHVHIVVSADRDGKEVRAQLKAWCARRLSESAGLSTSQTKNGPCRWFTERGDVEWINDDDHLQAAIRYVNEMQ